MTHPSVTAFPTGLSLEHAAKMITPHKSQKYLIALHPTEVLPGRQLERIDTASNLAPGWSR